MEINYKTEIKRYVFMLVACLLYAASLEFFLVPQSIVAGGISGLATLIYQYVPKVSVGTFIIIFNIPIVIVAFKTEGIKFTINCLITTVILGLLSNGLAKLMENRQITDDRLLSAVFGGVVQGVAIGLFCKYRMSSGGTELLGRFSHYIFKGISIPTCTAFFDGIVVITGAICMKDLSNVFYALIVIFITAKVSDMVLVGLNRSKLCYVISENAYEIGEYLIKNSPRGVTLLKGVGMYKKSYRGVLITVVKSNQVTDLRAWVNQIDPNAFVIVSETNEVLGNGFKGLQSEDMIEAQKRKRKNNLY